MAWRAMRQAALLLAMMLSASLSAGARAADPDALVRTMANQPLRYGGVLRGPVDGRLLLALDQPAPDGSLHGEAMLLTEDRHLIETASVAGEWAAAFVPGGHDCILRLALTGRTVILHGICAAEALSGEILTREEDADWLTRQIFWWNSNDTGGRYWLTETSFN